MRIKRGRELKDGKAWPKNGVRRPAKRHMNKAIFLIAMALHVQTEAKTIDDRLAEFGRAVRTRLTPLFADAGVPYPPSRMTLIGLKQERELQLYAAGPDGPYKLIRSYPILAASGTLGPKLREGDMQVPEGLYRIESLNPNSRFHLSLRVSYPNAFDREQAKAERRTNLGGDIMIHGNAVSIGCIAVGDPASEDLFILAAETGLRSVQVILAPVDFRDGKSVRSDADTPQWVGRLYESIKTELSTYDKEKPAEPKFGLEGQKPSHQTR